MGLWLIGQEEARAEALRDARELSDLAISAGAALDGEYQITSEDGEMLFTIPLKDARAWANGEADVARTPHVIH